MEENIYFDGLRRYVAGEREFESRIHGGDHWKQVEKNGLMIARDTGADEIVVKLFAIFHDSKRKNDGKDLEHGTRGAAFAKRCREEGRFVVTDGQMKKLVEACEKHTKVHKTGDETVDTCFDADRLDLGRVWIMPDPRRMATEAGARAAKDMMDEKVREDMIREWINIRIRYSSDREATEVD